MISEIYCLRRLWYNIEVCDLILLIVVLTVRCLGRIIMRERNGMCSSALKEKLARRSHKQQTKLCLARESNTARASSV